MLSTYVRLRILTFHFEGNQAPTICNLLREEGVNVSRVGVWKFLCHYKKMGCVNRKEGSGRPTKITYAVMAMVEGKMKENDETTAYQLHKILNENRNPNIYMDDFALSKDSWVDVSWQCLLPVDKNSKQGEKIRMGLGAFG